jgi:aminocarboxymuconate-semialdehyde decarboxylase
MSMFCMGTVPMQNIDMAIAEMRRCRSELGFRAIEIGSNIDGINLDDPSFYPLWEAAQGIDMGIFVHPWNMVGGDRMDRYWGKWLVGMPAETTLAITSMIFGGVFDKFPRLKVMFAHAGGAFPFTLGRISHGWNCRPDLVNVHNVSDPYTYVGKFWVDSITHDRDALRYLVSLLGADRIAYGTDYPFPLGDLEHGKMIEQMDDLGDDIKTKLFSKTWLDFLGLDTSSYL